MAAIKDVRVWSRGSEVRIYVHTEDGREGVKYLADTRWHKRGEIEGDLTADEWKEAKAVATRDNKWFTYVAALDPTRRAARKIETPKPANELTANGFPKAKRGDYCPRCGHFAEAGNDLVQVWNDDEDRNEYKVYHTDRSICEANIATAKAKRERRESFENHLRAFRARFQDAEYPPEADVEGETVYDTYSIYGAGSRIVIGDAWVWWVDNNGMDGDDWSRNNCRLGIARRLPRTDELVEDAHALVAEYAIIKADK